VSTPPQNTKLTLIQNSSVLAGAPRPRATSVLRSVPGKHGGLKRYAYQPVTVPKTLHAFAAFGEEALAEEPALQPFSGYRHEHCS